MRISVVSVSRNTVSQLGSGTNIESLNYPPSLRSSPIREDVYSASSTGSKVFHGPSRPLLVYSFHPLDLIHFNQFLSFITVLLESISWFHLKARGLRACSVVAYLWQIMASMRSQLRLSSIWNLVAFATSFHLSSTGIAVRHRQLFTSCSPPRFNFEFFLFMRFLQWTVVLGAVKPQPLRPNLPLIANRISRLHSPVDSHTP